MYSTGIERFGSDPSGLAVVGLASNKHSDIETKSAIISTVTIVLFFKDYRLPFPF